MNIYTHIYTDCNSKIKNVPTTPCLSLSLHLSVISLIKKLYAISMGTLRDLNYLFVYLISTIVLLLKTGQRSCYLGYCSSLSGIRGMTLTVADCTCSGLEHLRNGGGVLCGIFSIS